MKKLVALLFSLLGFAAATVARAEYYTFTSGSVIALNDSTVSDYVTSVSGAKANHTYTVDSTYVNGTFTLNLNNTTAGDYVFTMLGTGDGYSVNCKLEVNGVTDSSYSKTLQFLQTDTKTGTAYANTNLGDTNPTDCNAQKTFMALPGLPAGNFTIKFTIVSRTDGKQNWCGNYGYFTITKAVDIATNSEQMLYLGVKQSGFSSQTVTNYVTLTQNSNSNTMVFEGTPGQLSSYIGSTQAGCKLALSICCDEETEYIFDYAYGTTQTDTTIAWVLTDETSTEKYSKTDSLSQTDSSLWTLKGSCSHNFGVLPAGFYTLTATIGGGANWRVNFGNFVFTKVNEMLTAETSKTSDSLAAGYVIDLNGNNLTIGSGCSLSGKVTIMNTSNTDATFTADNAKIRYFLVKDNVKFVVNGTSTDNFRSSDANVSPNNNSIPANTHTGGTEITGNTGTGSIQIYNVATNMSSGAVIFGGNAHLEQASGNVYGDYPTFANDIVVNGDGNDFNVGPNHAEYRLLGNFSGTGSLFMYNGFTPRIMFKGSDNDQFTGTLYLAYTNDSNDRGYAIEADGIGFKNGTVCLTNRYTRLNGTAHNEKHWTHLKCKQNGSDVYFGHLITDDAVPLSHANTCVIAETDTTLHIGGKGLSGHFAGYFSENSGKAFTLIKEGAGDWELNGTENSSSLSGGVTVSAGTLTVNTTISAGAVSVASGATLAGSGTIPSVSFESGAVLSTMNMTVTGESNFTTAPYVYLDPNTLEEGQTYTILTSNSMPGDALLHEDMTNQIAGVELKQANNKLTLKVPAHIVAPGGTAENVSASSEEDALAAVAIKLTDEDIDAGRKTSYYKKVAKVTSTSGFWEVTVALDEKAVKVEPSNTTWTADAANNKITFTIATGSLKTGLYYGVATGTVVGEYSCSLYSQYDGTTVTVPTLTAALPPDSGVMYYTIMVSDTDAADSAQ